MLLCATESGVQRRKLNLVRDKLRYFERGRGMVGLGGGGGGGGQR